MPYPIARPSFAPVQEPAPRSFVHEQAAELISRYPDLSEPELGRLVSLFPRLSALDLALMMSDSALCPRLEAFCATNRAQMRPSLGDLAVIGAILSLPTLMLLVIVGSRGLGG